VSFFCESGFFDAEKPCGIVIKDRVFLFLVDQEIKFDTADVSGGIANGIIRAKEDAVIAAFIDQTAQNAVTVNTAAIAETAIARLDIGSIS
jgi:hypothetical protein